MIETIDVESRLFDGIGRIFIFPDVDTSKFTKTTTLADVLKDGKDLGKIVDGSGSWDGDEGTIEVLKSTEQGVIRSKDKAGTFAWSARVPHSQQVAKLAGAKVHTATSLGTDFKSAAGEEILGMIPKRMSKRCPVAILNLAHNELQLFPKGAVVFSPTKDDEDLQEYTVKAQAEDIDTANLSTMMFIPLGTDPFEEPEETD